MDKDKKNKLSDHERLKSESNFLRGTIVKDLSNELTGGFTGDNFHLIRFHGMYQQDDRDLRTERINQKLEPLISMMLRCRLPGGVIMPSQWLAINSFVSKHTLYGTMRLTSRQTLQIHGLLKRDLKDTHRILHHIGLDSIATAGDVNRNVICTSNPMESILHHSVIGWAKKISEHFLPNTRAYAEIWLDGEKTESTEECEPILGASYLPRKFKIALVIPPLNDVDAYANDLSFVAISMNKQLVGFNVLVGGGLAMTYGDSTTYPRIASDFGYIDVNDTIKVAEAIVTTQRDLGDRLNRKHAKTKYTLVKVGVDVFKKEVEKRSGIKFFSTHPYTFLERGDRFGWVKGIDDQWHFTVFIENGRIFDTEGSLLKTGLSEIASIHTGCFRLTANQNLIISSVRESDKISIESLLVKYKLINENISVQRKSSMACVSFPTCPLAMAESERFLPNFISKIENIMFRCGLSNDSIILRVTGCPNGCARAMLAEIGLVGRSVGYYNIYLGGNRIGTRIPRLYKENVTEEEILNILNTTIVRWSNERHPQESYGDYVIRVGIITPVLNSEHDFYG
ncbi:assimilatory sulfite reductase (NADPH) hemoprotein subunit [Blochmannia endosymbiont of Polyrhachis (Hedomyrma) turneri]|uniref:assimilatory sulfite reductase (NADPH) hemoprotein subunit n=1 Tax=Blochmannia endosymbiont of Polyrhachis (Hedomyrma) turneri TaxID=1505596 RepID=UPI00061A62AA|nr:assimilatory sulfite reductase (NADPH) hemoprotein subunit [Blochmannia endosymbiont of Polyrhachis (Hedomyrma) turneri]AKC59743.1 sulfite reductase (NADPH) hemoprotein beta-component [Blochmannia endosymbiont of Polyrhachis (Hedomyrma) turneri]